MMTSDPLTAPEEKMLAALNEIVGAVFRQVRIEMDTMPDRVTADPDLAGRVRAECAASLGRINAALMAAAEIVERKEAGHVAN